MKNPLQRLPLALAACALVAPACRTKGPIVGGPAHDEMSPRELESGAIENLDVSQAPVQEVDAPIDVAQDDSVWVYMSGRYDSDGDGTVTADEYRREGGDMGRFDRDGDGVLTVADFGANEGDGKRRGMSAEMLRGIRTQLAVGWYFQLDEDADRLGVEEAEAAFELYDYDSDGSLTADEFAELHQEQAEWGREPAGVMGSMARVGDPWAALVAGLDSDGNEGLEAEELASFLAQREEDGVIDLADRGRGGATQTGVAPGEPAPDFVLPLVHDEETLVQLSDHVGDKPVALVFGSYT